MASYNAYEEAIARAKSALDSYSSETEALARLYEQAKANAQAAYEAQKQETALQAEEARRMAGVDMQRTERNLDQRLAARGLAFSGENAQTRLDLTLALRNQLAGIDSDERAQYATLGQAHADRIGKLDMDYLDRRADAAKQLASLNADLAAAEANKQAAEEAAKAAAAAAAASASANKGDGKEKDKDAAAARKALLEKLTSPIRNAVEKATGKPFTVDENGAVSSGGASNAIKPEISARDLAKQMVTAVGSGGKIKGAVQQAALAELLDSVLKAGTFDDEYYRQLLLNLRSLGFRPDSAQKMEDLTEQLEKDTRDLYDTLYRRYNAISRNAGNSVTEADRQASAKARYEQLRYLYTHSTTQDQFETVADALSLTDYLEGFYSDLKEKDKNLKLGCEAE